ncbi:hypothetical protein FQR65_LT09986 [Abscondita terminalis]|nr:hypothetical protein FQR65_LT09986 [Abscondita terminalis]
MDMLTDNQSLGKYIAKLYKKYDTPYFGFFVISNPVVVIKDPELIKRILIKDFDSMGDKMLFNDDSYDPVFCNTLMGMNFTKWRNVRPQVTSIFTSGKMKMMLNLIKNCGKHMENYLSEMKGKTVDVNNVVDNFTANVVSSCIFGIECNCFEAHNWAYKYHGSHILPRSGLGAIKVYSYHFMHFLIKIFKFPFLTAESANFFSDVFNKTIEQRRKSGDKRNDLIDKLLDVEKAEENKAFKFDDKIMLGQAMGFFVAGYDTTTIITSLAIYEITKNAEIQSRLRKEINDVIERFGDLTYESLDSLTYTNMVISETLRKYPVVNFIQRKCVKEYIIPETNLKIDVGTNIIIPNHGLHYDEKYFENPEKFDPERFNDENKKNINPYVYMPFSLGPRGCVGKRFAMMTVKVGLVYFLRNFKFGKSLNMKTELTFKTSQIGHTDDAIEVTCEAV